MAEELQVTGTVKAVITRPSLGAASLSAVLALAMVAPAAAAPQSEPDKRLCAIEGAVIDANTGQGLRKAFVRLVGTSGSYPTITGDTGKFTLANIEPGTYTLEAERQGFIDGKLGDDSGVPTQLKLTAALSVKDLKVKLTPQAVISGRVVDEDGDPWIHAQVNLFRSGWTNGKRRLQPAGGGVVDDQGDFRLAQIPPGTYYLSAEPNISWESKNGPRGKTVSARQPTWYPSSLDSGAAVPIRVSAGGQFPGLEIRLRHGNTYRIRGTLVGLENISHPERGSLAAERMIVAEWTSVAAINGKFGTIHPDGSFEINGVPSGTFEVRVRQGFPVNNLGAVKVQVIDRDLEGVSIPLTPPGPVKGMIRIEEPASIKPSGIKVLMDPLGPTWLPSTHSAADGSFDFPLVGTEQYRITVGEQSGNGFYVKQIRYGETVSKDGTIYVTPGGGDLVLLLSTKVARVDGKVGGSPTTAPQVVLIPTGQTGQPRRAAFDQNGNFTLGDLAPGEYKLYAFEGLPDGAWEDPEFLKEVSSLGTGIGLAEGETRNLEVDLLSKSALAPILKKLGLE